MSTPSLNSSGSPQLEGLEIPCLFDSGPNTSMSHLVLMNVDRSEMKNKQRNQ